MLLQWGPDSKILASWGDLAHGGAEISNAASHHLSLSLGSCCGTFGVNQSVWLSLNSCPHVTKDCWGDEKMIAGSSYTFTLPPGRAVLVILCCGLWLLLKRAVKFPVSVANNILCSAKLLILPSSGQYSHT